MFGRWRFHHERPAFAWGSGYQPETEEGWQPWARPEHPERPPFGPPWARHEHQHFGPPWARHEHHHEHFGPPWGAWRMARGGFPFGPGGRGFPFGPGGRGPGGPRFMGRGDLKYVLLGLLRERPMHGYEMMKQLEEQASGFYSPSAGAIYPTLQMLEDRGWVTSETVDGKKIYTITDAGRQELEGQAQRAEPFHTGPFGWGGHHGRGGPFGRQAQPELHALRQGGMEVARLIMASVMASGGDPEKLARLRAIIERTRSDLQEFLGQAQASARGETSAPTSGTVEDA